MELQQFKVVGGDKDGDIFTIENVYSVASMTGVERAQYRLGLVGRWFRRLPERLQWKLYQFARDIADRIDPDLR